MITRKDVAELAGVSKTTVTRVLSGRGYVSDEKRKKVKDAVEKLNYIPNMIAKNLNQKFSNIVAVLVEDLTNQYYLQIISAMNSEAMQAGMMVSMFSVNKNNINSVIEDLIANRVRGIHHRLVCRSLIFQLSWFRQRRSERQDQRDDGHHHQFHFACR